MYTILKRWPPSVMALFTSEITEVFTQKANRLVTTIMTNGLQWIALPNQKGTASKWFSPPHAFYATLILIAARCHFVIFWVLCRTKWKNVKMWHISIRDVWRHQNGWTLGKVPKGGVSFSIQKFTLQILHLYTGPFEHNIKKIAIRFSRNVCVCVRGRVSKAVRNFSENSSLLVAPHVPHWYMPHFHIFFHFVLHKAQKMTNWHLAAIGIKVAQQAFSGVKHFDAIPFWFGNAIHCLVIVTNLLAFGAPNWEWFMRASREPQLFAEVVRSDVPQTF